MFKKIFIVIFILLIIGAVGAGNYLFQLYNSTKFDIAKLEHYHPSVTTKIYDRNGNLIANVFDKENRLYVPFDKIPGRLIEVLIATEDTSFFEHAGFNPEAIMRALIKDIKAGKKVEGASTLTQQVVKMMYLSREKKIKRKIKELFIATKIEHYLTKQQILEIYFNQVFLGHGYYGIKTAAEGYFHKDLDKLTLKEMAMLIALPKAPSYYDPTRHYNQNVARANIILRRLYSLGWISEKEYKQAVFEKPLVYNSTLTRNKAPYVVDMVLRTLSKDYPDIKTAGYKITLSIDLPTQKIAQDSLKWGYDRLKDKYELNTTSLNGAIVTIDSKTGDVLSAVGGVNYAKSSFNRVDQAMRSIGSAIKPFVYQQALDKGYNPATPIPDVARTYHIKGKTPRQNRYWRPKNYENDTLGFISLRMALVHSRNLATINLAQALGLENVIDGLYKFGFDKMPKDMSIVLGSFAVSPLKMAEEYTIFSNYGVKVKPRLILSLENKDKGLKVDFPVQKEKLIPNYQAYLMISILQDVVKKGTGVHARMRNIQVAGKTGTTNDYKDGWWCGFTPDTTTIVWFGRDDNTPIGRGMAGGKTSAPVFKHFYTDFLKIHPERRRRFVRPRGVRYFYYEDKKELYTKMSPPPPPKKQVSVPIF